MGNLVMWAAVGSLMMIVPAGPKSLTHAAPNDPLGAVEFCRWKMTFLPTLNMGECMSHVQMFFNSPNGMPAHECDALLETDPDLFEELFESYADCVQTARED